MSKLDLEFKVFFTVIMIICIVLIAFIVIELIGDVNPSITEGEVYEKEYRESNVILVPVVRTMVVNGKSQVHTSMIPYYYPDRYVIFIKGYNKDGQEVTEDFYVEKEIYDSIKIGDHFVYDKNTMQKDEPKEEYKE